MEKTEFLNQEIDKLDENKVYNLKDLSYIEYQKEVRLERESHNGTDITYNKVFYYGFATKNGYRYFDVLNNNDVSPEEITTNISLNKDYKVSVDELRLLLAKLEEEYGLSVHVISSSGNYGEGYKDPEPVTITKSQEENPKPLSDDRKRFLPWFMRDDDDEDIVEKKVEEKKETPISTPEPSTEKKGVLPWFLAENEELKEEPKKVEEKVPEKPLEQPVDRKRLIPWFMRDDESVNEINPNIRR